MNKAKLIINAMLGAIMTTLVILTISFIIMLFGSGEEGMRTTYFNTLFFQSETEKDGTLDINFGLTKGYLPIFITIIILFLFYIMITGFYKTLNTRKQKLKDVRKYE
jgi:hypothetical protein